jgi:CRP-like cAMP-binding protein
MDALERGLLSCPPFEKLSAASRTRIVRDSPLAYFAQGELIYVAGQPGDRLLLLLEGQLQIEYPEPGEQRGRVVAVVRAPYVLGEAQVLSGASFSGTGVAMTSILAATISRERIEELVIREPHFALGYVRELAFRFLLAIESRKRESILAPNSAIARYLAAFEDGEGAGDGRILPLHQIDIGRAAGVSRETTNRVMRAWAKRGVVRIGRSGVRIVRRDLLLEEIDRDAAPLVQAMLGQREQGRPSERLH